ncbi:hypothetical protein C8R42DRAFT_637377 [Lentinula raphanica]|nr:hypothetical protein C8R42DRAFT_637377 [Lentinula raphanica]
MAAWLAIPLLLDLSTFEGQLLITVAQSGLPGNVLHHPITGDVLLPDPSGLDDLPPASSLLNAWEDDDLKNEDPASPAADIDEYDDGETKVLEDIKAEDIFKAPKGKGKAKASIGYWGNWSLLELTSVTWVTLRHLEDSAHTQAD